jgi:diguanylate cyclase (GGDEF)-like protein
MRDSAPLWRWWLLFGVAVTVGYVLMPTDSTDTLAGSLYYDCLALASAGAIALGTRINAPIRPRMWYLFAAGQAIWAIGDFTFGYNLYVLGEESFPTIADGIYLTAYPVLAAGLFILIRGRTSGRDRAGLLDASVIATGLALLTWSFIMRPTAADDTLTVLERMVSLAYPAGDVLLLAMAARLFTTPGARTTSYRLLSVALVLLLGTDIAYAIVLTVSDYSGGLIDGGWMLSYVCWGAAALHPSMRSLSQTAPDQAVRLTPARLALLSVTALVTPAILVYQGLTEPDRIDWLTASVGAVVLFLLVLARMSGLVTQVQDQATQLDALAHNDALTGVPNRRAWDLELARRLANSRNSGQPVVVGLLDLDHFKWFNDRYGHQAGDRLLKEAAAAWRANLRAEDLLARYGGEEFGVCFTGLSAHAAATQLQRLQKLTPLGQTFSAGVARWTGDEAPERLVGRADHALYQAKNDGRDRVLVHEDGTAQTPVSGLEPLPQTDHSTAL